MVRKKLNVVTIIATIAISSLGFLGVGYAAWTDTLTLTSNVTTGTLDVDIVGAAEGTHVDPLEQIDCEVTPAEDGNSFTLKADNLYPGASCVAEYSVKNLGSIPVKLDTTQGGGDGIAEGATGCHADITYTGNGTTDPSAALARAGQPGDTESGLSLVVSLPDTSENPSQTVTGCTITKTFSYIQGTED